MIQISPCLPFTPTLRVAVIDHDPFSWFGLADHLSALPGVDLVGSAAYPEGAWTAWAAWQPHLLVLSVDPPHGPIALANLLIFTSQKPGARILLVANLLDPFLFDSLYHPAITGYLLKHEAGSSLANGLALAAGGAWVMTRTVCAELAKRSLQPFNPALIGE